MIKNDNADKTFIFLSESNLFIYFLLYNIPLDYHNILKH